MQKFLFLVLFLRALSSSADTNLNNQLLDATNNDDVAKVIGLLGQGADPTAQIVNSENQPVWTAVHMAAYNAAYQAKGQVFAEFLHRGINLNVAAKGVVLFVDSGTPIDLVMNSNLMQFGLPKDFEPTVMQMLDHGANPFLNSDPYPLINSFHYKLTDLIARLKSIGIPRDTVKWLINSWAQDFANDGYEALKRQEILGFFANNFGILQAQNFGVADWGRYKQDPATGAVVLTDTIVYPAITGKWRDAIDFFTAQGFNFNTRVGSGTICDYVHMDDDADFLTYISAKGCRFGGLSLFVALDNKSYVSAERLLALGVDINAVYDDGTDPRSCPALIYFSILPDREAWILNHSPNVNRACEDGRTALFQTVRNIGWLTDSGALALANLGALVKSAKDLNVVFQGRTPLQEIAYQYGNSGYSDDSRELMNQAMKLFLSAGDDPNFSGMYNPLSTIALALFNGKEKGLQAVDLLLSFGADAKVGAVDGRDDALHGIAEQCNFAGCDRTLTSLLVKGMAILNFKNRYGFTALCLASRNDHADLVGVLLGAKADATIDCGGSTAYGLSRVGSRTRKVFEDAGVSK